MKPQKSIAIRLSKNGERAVKQGHPWVFENSIEKGPKAEVVSGTLCVLFDRQKNRPYAFGLWDASEVIRIKILSVSEKINLNGRFWQDQLATALAKREELLKNVTGYRAIHGENDEFPGLVLDVYDTTGVLKIYSEIWMVYLNDLLPILMEIFSLERIILRWSRKLLSSEKLPHPEGKIIGEPLDAEAVVFQEYGVSFYAYPVTGHKTGFFLDQRPNRLWVQEHAEGKRVLDVFSYVGAFSMHAIKGGAKSVIAVDISKHAMDVAEKNLSINGFNKNKFVPVVEDAFKVLETFISEGKSFDLVIIDPPSFAKQAKEVPIALKQYERLAGLGSLLTAAGGILLLGSCSSRVSMEAFMEAHEAAFDEKNTQMRKLQEVSHDVDHPVRFPEASYLKTLYYYKK